MARMARAGAIMLIILSAGMRGFAEENRQPFFTYVLGLSGPHMIAEARSLGVNTLYLAIDPGHAEDLAAIKIAARKAQQAGLQVIVQLPTILGGELGISLDDTEYVAKVTALLRKIVTELAPEKGITAWATSDFLERSIHYTSAAFQSYLKHLRGLPVVPQDSLP